MKNAKPTSTVKVDPSWRIGIVHSTWYPELLEPMIADAKATLIAAGIPEHNITTHPCPGSFEIPLIGAALAETKKIDALIALGIIVRGETHHAGLIAEAATRGVMDVQLTYGVPFAFEILYVHDIALAKQRADKGRLAAHTTIQSLSELQRIRG